MAELPPLQGLDNDDRLLVNNPIRLMLVQQRFPFATAAPVQMPRGESRPVAGTQQRIRTGAPVCDGST